MVDPSANALLYSNDSVYEKFCHELRTEHFSHQVITLFRDERALMELGFC